MATTQKPSRLIEGLHVFVLTSFAVAQPVLGSLSGKRVYLEDQGIGGAALLIVAVILLILIPALLVLVEVAAGWYSEAARQRAHWGVVFVLLSALALPVPKVVKFLPGLVEVPLALGLGAFGLLVYRRLATARMFVTAASPAFLVFPAYFFFFSPIFRYLFPEPKSAGETVSARNPVPVVLVVLDEFCGTSLLDERKEMDPVRYPNFAALGQTATWYRNATSVHIRTDWAVPSILTGVYPHRRGEAIVSNYPLNLFTLLLSTEQYELTVFEPYTRLFPPEADLEEVPAVGLAGQVGSLGQTLPSVYLQQLLPEDLPVALPDIPLEWFRIKRPRDNRPDKQTGLFRYGWNYNRDEQFEHFLRLITPSQTPRLYFSHLAAPHSPWCYLPSGRRYVADDGGGIVPRGGYGPSHETWGSDELVVAHAYQRYLLQVGYVDHLIGKLLARLREVELFDSALLIVVADHGSSFRPGQSRRAAHDTTLPDIASVPLFIKLPHQHEGAISDQNVELVDVLPTIVDVLGIPVPYAMHGASLLDPSQPERLQKTFYRNEGPVTIAARFPTKYESLETMLATFGSGTSGDRMFKIGPHSELIGRTLDSVDVTGEAELEIKLNRTSHSLHEKPDELSPCYLEGRVRARPGLGFPVHLAIAVNGTIQAVTRTYLERDLRDLWTAMVPESSLEVGENDVRVFVVTSDQGKLRLSPTIVK